jgi:hypothetical protein
MDPYKPLAGNSPGAAQEAPQVPETTLPALAVILVLALVGLVRIRNKAR